MSYLLGLYGEARPSRSNETSSQRCADLSALALRLRRLGFEVEQARLSPGALRDAKEPVVVMLHLPGNHQHFEVYLGFTGAPGAFADVTLASGKARHRNLARLGDVWDGDALIVHRGPMHLAGITPVGSVLLLVFLFALGAGRLMRGRQLRATRP